MTLKLSGLRRVIFNLDDYRGQWSIANWEGAEATGLFRRDGGEQAIELVPNITYALKIGPVVVERFQVDSSERVTLIDGRGAFKISKDVKNKLVLSTISAAFYPAVTPPVGADVTWSLAGLAPADGRPGYKGPVVLRLAQGATYRLAVVGAGPQDKPQDFKTGNGCNMGSQVLKMALTVIYVTPILLACRN
jgi:hypothetical protein